MSYFPSRRRAAASLPLSAATIACAAGPAAAAPAGHAAAERLVVRGEATIQEGAGCPAGVCQMQMTGGAFRGTLGTGAYDGTVALRVAAASPNGEGGVCAPLAARVTLGAGSADRLVLAITALSCQDGAGNPAASSFTTVGRFVVKGGTGRYAHASGRGLATFAEDAADRDRMTLIGRIVR